MTDKNIAKKEKAIELMKRLDIYKPYIKGFRESDKVCFFEGFGGFWIDQEPEIYAKMKAIEKKYGYLGLRHPYLYLYRNQGGLMKPFKATFTST